MSSLFRILQTTLYLYSLIILLEVVLSWVHADPRKPPRSLIRPLTDPVLLPFRTLIPPRRTGGLDVSPLLVFLLLGILHRSLATLIPG